MKTSDRNETKVVHAAFLDALSGEFIARTGCGAYVYLNPVDVYQLFSDYLQHGLSVKEYVKRCVKAILSA